MKKALLSAAALLASAEARGRFRPRQVPSDWTPARQTLAAMDMFADQQAAAAPQPTSAPDVPDFLLRRDRDHTCGYISGEDSKQEKILKFFISPHHLLYTTYPR